MIHDTTYIHDRPGEEVAIQKYLFLEAIVLHVELLLVEELLVGGWAAAGADAILDGLLYGGILSLELVTLSAQDRVVCMLLLRLHQTPSTQRQINGSVK